MREQIKRLGFDAWADNIIVNVIEDGKLGDYVLSDDSFTIVITDGKDGEYTVAVRAYVDGWQYHERTFRR